MRKINYKKLNMYFNMHYDPATHEWSNHTDILTGIMINIREKLKFSHIEFNIMVDFLKKKIETREKEYKLTQLLLPKEKIIAFDPAGTMTGRIYSKSMAFQPNYGIPIRPEALVKIVTCDNV